MAYIYKRGPNKQSRALLARAWEHVQGVPYSVTARWLFYQLYQEGWYKDKSAYNSQFLPLLSSVRHSFWGDWRPDTLVDDRRSPIVRGHGYLTPEAWADAMREQTECQLARWVGQRWYVEVWFEAEAMERQFKHYTKGIVLRAFSGHPSIDYKWRIAKDLERYAQYYAMTVKVLYFGDWDDSGREIPEVAAEHIAGWCGVDFDFERIGLNRGDAERFGLSPAIDKPGYQWEALNDTQAGQMITEAVARYVDYDAMADVEELERQTTESFRRFVAGFDVGE